MGAREKRNLRSGENNRCESGEAGGNVHDDTASEVVHAPKCKETIRIPDPMREGAVDQD